METIYNTGSLTVAARFGRSCENSDYKHFCVGAEETALPEPALTLISA
jgi:hypothetical protein